MSIHRNVKINGGLVHVSSSQDVTAAMDEAKARSNEGLHGSSEMRHAAQLPMILVDKYCHDNGITFEEWMHNPEHVRVMLNDPSLSHFRVWKGRA